MNDASPRGTALSRARSALGDVEVLAASPFAAANTRAKAWAGTPSDAEPLLESWQARQAGNIGSHMRYRWDVSHRRCRLPSFSPPPETWRAFRAAEQPNLERDPFAFEERLAVPILVAESCEYLEELTALGGPVGAKAHELLAESDPVFRRDLAQYVLASEPWADTFALYCLARTPRSLERLRPIATALATSYSAISSRTEGIVLGQRYPFHRKPLVSANAHLALGLWHLGLQVSLLAPLIDFVKNAQSDSGGWGDAGGAEDLITTLAAADLLVHVDPWFDVEPMTSFLLPRQQASGFFVAMGPEAAWLTAAIGALLAAAERPFPVRFRWPSIPPASRDRKTGLPPYAYFDDVTQLFSQVPGIARTSSQMAFIDLIGFRVFNNAYGQDLGDAVLEAFAHELATIPGCMTIRDGGDEFLVVGAPGHDGLLKQLDAVRHTWPERFQEKFGHDAPPVAPRMVVRTMVGQRLRETREALGRAIGELKEREGHVGPTGVLVGNL